MNNTRIWALLIAAILASLGVWELLQLELKQEEDSLALAMLTVGSAMLTGFIWLIFLAVVTAPGPKKK